jgi:hypothetical protein
MGFFASTDMNLKGIVMGVGAPQNTRNNGITVCCILLSETLGFVRIYCIPADIRLSVWSVREFECNRGSDSRSESYKFESVSEPISVIKSSAEKRKILEECVIKTGEQDPIDFQNENRQSILLVELNRDDCEYTLSAKSPKGIVDDDECGWLMTQGKHWMKPFIGWRSHADKPHRTHLGGKEIYETLRKNPDQPFRVFENLQVLNPDYTHWMLLGNMNHHRTAFLCVHLFRLKKQTCGSTPLFSNLQNGRSDDWPYLKQEARNVKTADPQLDFAFIT